MSKLTPELIKEMLDIFFGGNPRNIYLSFHDDSIYFEGDNKLNCDLDGELCGHFYRIEMGAFKMCLIFDDFDEVIKINSKGSFIYRCPDEDCEYDAQFEIYNEWDNDFIEDEIKIYETFDDSVKSFFLPNKFIMDYHGIKIYTQEKIASTYSERSLPYIECAKLIDEYELVAANKEIPNTGLEIVFVEQIIHSYKDSFKILETIANYVDDLHGYNIGYTFDGRPVCHDYGGASY